MSSVLFVFKRNIFNFEVAIVLSILRTRGIEAQILFEEQEQDHLLEAVVEMNPCMVGFCTELAYILDSTEGELQENLLLLKRIKEQLPDTLSFIGGMHATLIPEIIGEYPFIDLLFFGDMENSLVEVAECLLNNGHYQNTRGIVYRKNGTIIHNQPPVLTELSKLPFPDLDSFLKFPGTFRKGYRLPVARGCPNNCSFCYNHTYKEHIQLKSEQCPRYYPVPYLIASLQFLKEREAEAFQTLYLVYNTFTHSKEFVREFCKEYKKVIDIPYVIATRLDTIDEEIALLLKESNCSKVNIAIESGVEELRNGVLNKNLTDKEIYRGMKILKQYNLRVGCSSLFGFPDETIDDAFVTLEMARKIKADFMTPSVYVPIPNTELANYAVEKGYLPKEFGIKHFQKTILSKKDYNAYQNIFYLTHLYQLFPIKPLFKVLVRFPNNRFYHWIYHLQRIRAVLKYDMGHSSIIDKVKYILYANYMIFVLNRRPDLLLWGQKITDKAGKRTHRGML